MQLIDKYKMVMNTTKCMIRRAIQLDFSLLEIDYTITEVLSRIFADDDIPPLEIYDMKKSILTHIEYKINKYKKIL